MSDMYNVRDRNGYLKCTLPARIVSGLINFDQGGWITVRTTNGQKRVYRIRKDVALDLKPHWRNEKITIFLLEGDTVELVNNA